MLTETKRQLLVTFIAHVDDAVDALDALMPPTSADRGAILARLIDARLLALEATGSADPA